MWYSDVRVPSGSPAFPGAPMTFGQELIQSNMGNIDQDFVEKQTFEKSVYAWRLNLLQPTMKDTMQKYISGKFADEIVKRFSQQADWSNPEELSMLRKEFVQWMNEAEWVLNKDDKERIRSGIQELMTEGLHGLFDQGQLIRPGYEHGKDSSIALTEVMAPFELSFFVDDSKTKQRRTEYVLTPEQRYEVLAKVSRFEARGVSALYASVTSLGRGHTLARQNDVKAYAKELLMGEIQAKLQDAMLSPTTLTIAFVDMTLSSSQLQLEDKVTMLNRLRIPEPSSQEQHPYAQTLRHLLDKRKRLQELLDNEKSQQSNAQPLGIHSLFASRNLSFQEEKDAVSEEEGSAESTSWSRPAWLDTAVSNVSSAFTGDPTISMSEPIVPIEDVGDNWNDDMSTKEVLAQQQAIHELLVLFNEEKLVRPDYLNPPAGAVDLKFEIKQQMAEFGPETHIPIYEAIAEFQPTDGAKGKSLLGGSALSRQMGVIHYAEERVALWHLQGKKDAGTLQAAEVGTICSKLSFLSEKLVLETVFGCGQRPKPAHIQNYINQGRTQQAVIDAADTRYTQGWESGNYQATAKYMHQAQKPSPLSSMKSFGSQLWGSLLHPSLRASDTDERK